MDTYQKYKKIAEGHVKSTQRQQPENTEKMFFKLKELHEVLDESRNEQCPMVLEENSIRIDRPHSEWSQNLAVQKNILEALEYDQNREESHQNQLSNVSKFRLSNFACEKQLKQSNRKLLQDNKILFSECLRLRKLFQEREVDLKKERAQNIEKTNKINHQHEIIELRKELQSRQQKNDELKKQIENLRYQNFSLVSSNQQAMCAMKQLQKDKELLTVKIEDLQHQIFEINYRNPTKSNQSTSLNTSTLDCKRTDSERDRMITNMKIVHESELKKLKIIIEDQRKQISKLDAKSSYSGSITSKRNN